MIKLKNPQENARLQGKSLQIVMCERIFASLAGALLDWLNRHTIRSVATHTEDIILEQGLETGTQTWAQEEMPYTSQGLTCSQPLRLTREEAPLQPRRNDFTIVWSNSWRTLILFCSNINCELMTVFNCWQPHIQMISNNWSLGYIGA